MNSNSVSSVSHAKRRVQAASKEPRNELPTTLQELKAAARRCQTPKQFRELLESLRELIPYRKLGAVWEKEKKKKRGQATFLPLRNPLVFEMENEGQVLQSNISRRVTGGVSSNILGHFLY